MSEGTQEASGVPSESLLTDEEEVAEVQPAESCKRPRQRRRTVFTAEQKAELEDLFASTQFPDYDTLELVASRIHLDVSIVQIWFKNRRVKWRKDQLKDQQVVFSLRGRPPKRYQEAEPNFSAKGGAVLPGVVGPCCVALPGPSEAEACIGDPSEAEACTGDPSEAEACTGDSHSASQSGDSELDGLEATIPALFSGPYDISHVIEMYECFEMEESPEDFSCLSQYLSLSDN